MHWRLKYIQQRRVETELAYLDLRWQAGIEIGAKAQILAFHIQSVKHGNIEFPELHLAVEPLRKGLNDPRPQHGFGMMDRILSRYQARDEKSNNEGENDEKNVTTAVRIFSFGYVRILLHTCSDAEN